ncbi:Mitochondrial distribution and morphology protein 12 [Mortierella sp. GBA30]|nr:Mitochondrial distribution and morphology protein 12 [Mortierella sp. GBA30]
MSFVFSWDKLDDEVALQIEGMIHAHFQRIPKPAFMGNIAVSKFRFGSTPPSVTVLDVTDPLEEWYVHMDQEEARLAQEAAEAGGGESLDEDELASDYDQYDDQYPYSADEDESIVMVGEGDDIEYLNSGAYEEQDQLETDAWLRDSQQRQGNYNSSSGSGDSYKEEHQASPHEDPTASSLRQTYSRNEGSASEQEEAPSFTQHRRRFVSPPMDSNKATSSSSSASSLKSRSSNNRISGSLSGVRKEDASTRMGTAKRPNPNLKLDIETSMPSLSSGSSVTMQGATHSLSSHASDDEIESEAFYTHGESTIYQRMKNMVLEPSVVQSPGFISAEGELSEDSSRLPKQQHQSGTGLGLGFGAGVGPSPGSVLSTVMQTRSSTRPLSAASFYSAPPSASITSPTPQSGQPPQLYFSDLSGMVLSGNSLLGLRAGTPSRTIPGTPRGFESPTLAFSRRQSFSDTGDESRPRATIPLIADKPATMVNGTQNRDAYVSPVEALSFDVFSQRPTVVERMNDDDVATDRSDRRDITSQLIQGDQRSRSSSFRYSEQRPSSHRSERKLERQRQNQRDSSRYRPESEASTPASFSSPSMPSKRHENDIQLLLSVQYQGQMGFAIETELLLNYPTFAFLALPVKLVITGFSFKAVLKNVGKIERFVVEQLRKFITEDFVYPSYHSVELQRAPPPSEPTGLTSGIPTGSMASPAGVTSSPSTATASTTTNNASVKSATSTLNSPYNILSFSTSNKAMAHSQTTALRASSSLPYRSRPHTSFLRYAPIYVLMVLSTFMSLFSSFASAAPLPHNSKRGVDDVGNRILDDARSGPFNVSIQAGIAGAILIAAGFILCFLGYRVFHITMFLIGFYFFGNISYIAMVNGNVTSQTLLLIVSIAVGIVGGLLLVCCSRLGVAVLGALALYALGLWILGLKSGGLITSNTGRIILLACLAVVGFFLGLCRERETVIVGSAIVGAYSFVIGVDMFAHTGFTAQADSFIHWRNTSIQSNFENQTTGAYALLGTFVGMSILGMVVQFWSFGRRTFRPVVVSPAAGNVVYTEKPGRFGRIFRR